MTGGRIGGEAEPGFQAAVTLTLPPLPPGLVNQSLFFAFAAAEPWSFASTPWAVRVGP